MDENKDINKEKAAFTNEAYLSHSQNDLNQNGVKNGGPHFNGEKEDKESQDEEIETKDKVQPIGLFQLFRFADGVDKAMMVVGTMAAMVTGIAQPLSLMIYGSVLDIFINHAANLAAAASNVNDTTTAVYELSIAGEINGLVKYFVIIGCCTLITGYLQMAMWVGAAERQTKTIRSLAYKAILRQSIGWFDVNQTGELNTRLTGDILQINMGIGDKLATFIQWMSTFVAGYTIGFVYGWKLTLVILAMAPLIVGSISILSKTAQMLTAKEQTSYAEAGSIAEQALSAIRTVTAFGGQQKETARYSKNLELAASTGQRKGLIMGTCISVVWFILFSSFGLSFWYGSKLARDGEISGGGVLMVFLGVLFGTMSLANAAPNIEFIAKARGAAASVFKIIETKSEIDSSSEEGLKPASIDGNIRFEDIVFQYPSRPDVPILKGLNLSINVGQTVALVGPSGCGKSTTVQLLQRFYDPESGTVRVDRNDVKDLNIKWLRQHIGVVSQEPVLFSASIADNIRHGKDGVTQAEIEQAAREANAHDFIAKLPEKYETLVGQRGAKLSGGQKQRVAIARALVRNPKILLLDEATSALDNESEAIVQEALDKASAGRTTIVIAHRLSTIKNADVIVGIVDGQVQEQGSHDELMQHEGIYHALVNSQIAALKSEEQGYPLFEEVEDEEYEDDSPIKRATARSMSQVSVRSSGSTKHRRMSIVGPSGKKLARRQSSVVSKMSTTSNEWNEKEEEKMAAKLPTPSFRKLIAMNAPEWPYILVACAAGVLIGAVHPVFGVVMSEVMGNFSETDQEKQKSTSQILALVFCCIGFVVGVAQIVVNYFFGISGEALTIRLRRESFRAMLRQEMAWFDDSANQVGALTARLATDAALVRGAAGQQCGTIIETITNVMTSLVIAFIFGWKLALVVLAFFPFLVISGVGQGLLAHGSREGDKSTTEEAGKVAVESIDNIRTVAALTREEKFHTKYIELFDVKYKKSVRMAQMFGAFFGAGQMVTYTVYAAAFSFGAFLIDRNEISFVDMYKVFLAVTFGAQAVGRAFSVSPDLKKAKMASAKILKLLEKEPSIDSLSESGEKPSECSGKVNFRSVGFRYPTRQDIQVLQGLDLEVNPGQTLALVGASGCGKSTTIQLMERFYDPEGGAITLDDKNTQTVNIQWMRSQLGLVAQEPILFDTSIRENIAYGDNSRDVTMDEIIQAAREANIHNFVEGLPLGYDTNVGDKGAQLSGGQKQRVAIARALIRKPKVLLLDEATSALDTESEKIVQEALDKARVGRTCIVIAHRLSTIQTADIIAVIHNGVVVEKGTHSDLMFRQGYYYRLQQAQKVKSRKNVQDETV